jgi:hypothetical protein
MTDREALAWIDAFPAVAALRDDASLADVSLHWLDEKAGRERGARVGAHYDDDWHLGVIWSRPLWAACKDTTRGVLCVAAGPSFVKRTMPGYPPEPSGFFLDPARPSELLFALSDAFPAALWIRVDATADAMRSVISAFAYGAEGAPAGQRRLDLPRVERAYMGALSTLTVPNPYSGNLDPAGPHELERHWTSSPVVGSLEWGSAFDDDPWAEQWPKGMNFLVLQEAIRRHRAQQAGATARITRWTLFSRSQMTIELHRNGHYVWELRYRPAPHRDVIERFNATTGMHLPLDLPVDLACAVHGFEFLTAERLEARLREEQDEMVGSVLRVLAAVRHTDVTVTDLIRTYLRHPDEAVRRTLASVAIEYNWEFLLEDITAAEAPGALRDQLDHILDVGINPPTFNDNGEPDWFYPASPPEESEESEEGT